MRNKRTFILAVSLTTLFFSRAHAVDFSVAPNGRDTNPGSKERPFATVQAAQRAVRGLIASGLTEPVDVIFRAGTYFLRPAYF